MSDPTAATASLPTPTSFVLKPAEAGNVLLRSVQRFYAEKKLFDVSISCKGRTLFGCHKLVLASCSSYFEILLSDTDGFAILNLDAVDTGYVKHLSSIVDFMYGHSIAVPKVASVCQQLYEAARIFGVTALIKTLEVRVPSLLRKNSKPGTTASTLEENGSEASSKSADREDEMVTLKSCGIGPLLLVSFQRFKYQAKFIDAKICCRDQLLFTCHKLVLASFSAYFETLLSTTEGSAILNLDAVDAFYVRQLATIIDYMYGKTTWVKTDDADLLRDAAHVFGVHALEVGDFERRRQQNEKSRRQKALTEKLDHLRNDTESMVATSGGKVKATGRAPKRMRVGGNGSAQTRIPSNLSLQSRTPGVNGVSVCHNATPSVSAEGVTEEVISQGYWSNAPVSESVSSNALLSSECLEEATSSLVVSGSTAVGQSVPCHDLSSFALCRHCGKTFQRNTTALRSHLLKHQIPSSWNVSFENNAAAFLALKCAECHDVFRSPAILRVHWEMTHGTLQTERGCFQCGLVFLDKEALRRHETTAHVEVGALNAVKLAPIATSSSPAKKASKISGAKSMKVTCKACGFTTVSFSSFVDHVDNEHSSNEAICHACDQAFADRQTLNVHYREVHNLVLFVCNVCDKVFKTLAGFKNHVDTHGQEHRCSSCEFTTSTRKNLEVHVKKYHPAVTSKNSDPAAEAAGTSVMDHLPHKCSECSASFLYECLLARHFQRKHLKLRPYKCPYCGHSATEKAALQTHIRCVHTKETPFVCDVCSLKCKTYSLLKRHKRAHTGEKSHICDQCGAGYTEKRDLMVHCWKVHEKVRPFKCATCNLGFLRKDNLLQHERAKHGKFRVNF